MANYTEIQERLERVFGTRFLFVTGLTRAGTVWVQNALDAHPEVVCRGEGHFTNVLRPLVDEALRKYNDHSIRAKVLIEAAGGRSAALGFSPDDIEALTLLGAGLAMAHVLADKRVRYLGERTPEYTMGLPALDRLVPEGRVVHVIRDGRDETAAAWEFNLRTRRKGFVQKYPTLASYAEAFALQWGASVGRARAHGRQNRDRYLEIRYEDIEARPGPSVERICNFLGIAVDSEIVKRCVQGGRGWALNDSGTGQWRHLFDDAAKDNFHRHAGELLKLLGYQN